MADVELTTAPIQGLPDGGYLPVVRVGEATKKLPVADIAAAAELAAGALQPADVGGAAYEDAEAYVRVAEYEETIATKDAEIADLYVRISTLESLIGVGSITVFEPDIYEPGVFVG